MEQQQNWEKNQESSVDTQEDYKHWPLFKYKDIINDKIQELFRVSDKACGVQDLHESGIGKQIKAFMEFLSIYQEEY